MQWKWLSPQKDSKGELLQLLSASKGEPPWPLKCQQSPVQCHRGNTNIYLHQYSILVCFLCCDQHQKQLGKEMVYRFYMPSLQKEVQRGTINRNLKNTVDWFAPHSLISFLSYTIQDHPCLNTPVYTHRETQKLTNTNQCNKK